MTHGGGKGCPSDCSTLTSLTMRRSFACRQLAFVMRKEIHAQEFVSGRGRISAQILAKYERTRIFEGLLHLVASLPNVMVINICLETSGRKNPQLDAWDRLLNRIERTLVEIERRELRLRKHLLTNLPTEFPDELRGSLSARLNSYNPVHSSLQTRGRR